MSPHLPRTLLEIAYEKYAQEYLRNLPLEHFMEATAQATQRKITLESLDLVHARRPEVQVFNELLVQYPLPGQKRPGQVVPDNMVVVCKEPVKAQTSFNLPLEPAGPFWVLEYVSKGSRRKDYDDNFDKYEKELKVPYYLTFYPEVQELTLYRHTNERYEAVSPNDYGRYSIPELELEVGLLEGWVRFWYQGQLLPLPGELQRDLDEARLRAEEEKRRADEQQRRAEEEKRRADEQQRRAEELAARLATVEQALAQLRSKSDSSPPIGYSK